MAHHGTDMTAYRLSTGIAAGGFAVALWMGADRLMTPSDDGLPWLVPSLAAGALLVVADTYARRSNALRQPAGAPDRTPVPGRRRLRRRADGRRAVSGLCRLMADTYALGAACAGLVPLRAWLGLERSAIAEAAHDVLILALALQAVRVLVETARLAWRLKTRRARSATTAMALVVAGVAYVVIAGAPDSPSAVVAVAIAAYLAVTAAPTMLFTVLPRRST